MQVVYDKIAIHKSWSSHASSPAWHKHCDRRSRPPSTMHWCVHGYASVDFAFITADVEKMRKNATYGDDDDDLLRKECSQV